MQLQMIQIIREMTDFVPGQRKNHKPFCNLPHEQKFWQPNTDIYETSSEVVIRLELAGVEREDIMIKMKNGFLLISGIRKDYRPDCNTCYHQLGIHYGKFEQKIPIPEQLEHNEVSALLQQGILEIKISKTGKTEQIPII